MGVHKNPQVEDIVAMVSFLTYLLQINGFQIFVEAAAFNRQHLVKAFVDGTKCFIETMHCNG
jgi:hypothetical protein